eukprot:3011150-Rhodomonas_salina.1
MNPLLPTAAVEAVACAQLYDDVGWPLITSYIYILARKFTQPIVMTLPNVLLMFLMKNTQNKKTSQNTSSEQGRNLVQLNSDTPHTQTWYPGTLVPVPVYRRISMVVGIPTGILTRVPGVPGYPGIQTVTTSTSTILSDCRMRGHSTRPQGCSV